MSSIALFEPCCKTLESVRSTGVVGVGDPLCPHNTESVRPHHHSYVKQDEEDSGKFAVTFLMFWTCPQIKQLASFVGML